jgi:hypothetical protein
MAQAPDMRQIIWENAICNENLQCRFSLLFSSRPALNCAAGLILTGFSRDLSHRFFISLGWWSPEGMARWVVVVQEVS